MTQIRTITYMSLDGASLMAWWCFVIGMGITGWVMNQLTTSRTEIA